MAYSFRKRMVWIQAGLMLAAAAFGFSVVGGTVTSEAQADATLTPTPNGGGHGEIAFTSDRDHPFPSDPNRRSQIYMMDADGGNVRRLTNDLASDFSP